MNPAPDLATVLDFEGNIEPACKSRLEALGINRAQVQQGTGDQESGRVDVELIMGAHRSGCYYVPDDLPDGEIDTRACYENAWDAILEFTVVTNRDKPEQNHAAYRREVRVLMLQFFTGFPVDLLPFHEISLASTAGTTPGLLSAKDEDATKLRWKIVVSVRDGAWPVAVSSD